MLFALALAIGSAGFAPGLVAVAHGFPTGPVDPW
jgi:hypothetical protein